MSWQAYVDTSLVGTGNLDQAAIFSADGTSVWATSPGFQVKPAEIQAIINSFKASDSSSIMGTGFHVGGVKYMAVRSDNKVLVGKKGKSGIAAVKTNQAILIAHHPDDVQTQAASATVEALADYLIGVGY